MNIFAKVLQQLDEAVELMRQRDLSRLEKQGVIQGFEYSYELGWNTLNDFLVWQGIEGIVGFRDSIREAFSKAMSQLDVGSANGCRVSVFPCVSRVAA